MVNTEVTQCDPGCLLNELLALLYYSNKDEDRAEAVRVGHGITVYRPAAGGMAWRAVFVENGRRRYLQATTEVSLAAKLTRVVERLAAEAVNMESPALTSSPTEIIPT
jgi:hypothetical protein